MKKNTVTRRDFLRGTAGIVMAAGLGAPAPSKAGTGERARVILIRHPKVLGSDGRVDGTILQPMLDEAVQTLAGEKNPLAAWQRFFKKSDVVGAECGPTRVNPASALRCTVEATIRFCKAFQTLPIL